MNERTILNKQVLPSMEQLSARARSVFMPTRRWLCLVLLLLWRPTPLRSSYAQSSFAEITGTVTDQTSAVVPNVHLILRNDDTGIERTTNTGSAGTYYLADV